MIEDASQRVAPTEAGCRCTSRLPIRSTSTSQFSGWMSVLLMLVVLAFFVVGRVLAIHGSDISAEVLCFVLSLLGRPDRADRTSGPVHRARPAGAGRQRAHHRLGAAHGDPRRCSRVLPGHGLGHHLDQHQHLRATIADVVVVLDAGASPRMAAERRPAERGQPRPSGLALYTDSPDYSHTDVLRSSWWRNTTADALMVAGRPTATWSGSTRLRRRCVPCCRAAGRPHRQRAGVLGA